MKILLVHNHYQRPGGEDAVFAAEGHLLECYGHSVLRYTAHNDQVGARGALSLAASTLWNRAVHHEMQTLLARENPDVVHVHNTLPLISPAVYYAAHAAGVAVVQTLHNYRLMCPNALFFREGRVCESCLGRSLALPAIVHGCYRNSRAASSVVVAMLGAHRAVGTWHRQVDRFIALTNFAKQKHVEGGLPAERISVKPNFVQPDPGMGTGDGGYALYLGRLSHEKGVRTMLDAWQRPGVRIPLKVVGDGPLAPEVSAATAVSNSIEWLGHRGRADVLGLLQRATFLVCPSECYENFPLVVAEAFATGVPVIASDGGSIASIVSNGLTGLHFRTGDAAALAEQAAWAWEHPSELASMRRNARAEYEALYTAERNHEMLLSAYEGAIAHARARRMTGATNVRLALS